MFTRFFVAGFVALGVASAIQCAPRRPTVPQSAPSSSPAKGDFLSQTDPDYAFLEQVQSNAYDIPGSFPPFGKNWEKIATGEDLIGRIADLGTGSAEERNQSRAALEKILRGLPQGRLSTRLENPYVYFIIATANEHVTAAIRDLGYKDTNVVLGTLPTFSANARNMSAPSGRRVIVVNSGLFNAVNRFVKALAPVVLIETQGDKVSLGLSDEWTKALAQPTSENFIHFVEVGFEYLRVAPGEQYMLSDDHMLLQVRLISAMEIFVLAHEHAHSLLSHGARQGEPKALGLALTSDAQMTPAEALLSWIRELEADRLGFRLMIKALEIDKAAIPEVMAAGPDLALQLLDYLDRTRDLYRLGLDTTIAVDAAGPETLLFATAVRCIESATSDSCKPPAELASDARFSDHPPGSLRRKAIREYMVSGGFMSPNRDYLDIGAGFAQFIQLSWANVVKVYAAVRSRQSSVP